MRSHQSLVAILFLAASLAGACASTPSQNNTGSGGSSGGDAAVSRASMVTTNGYVTAGPWMGYGFTATDPGAATIMPDCTNGCMPPFTGTDFCMTGTVTGKTDYSGFAMLGWN